MKEKILKLRSEGKSYGQIVIELGCSKSTISFHCGEGQKDKSKKRLRIHRAKNATAKLTNRVHIFTKKKLKSGSRDFQRRDKTIALKRPPKISFNYKDIIKKFGENTICYLSGEKIHLLNDNHYCFDHIIPATRDGSNELENLGILHKVVNKMKSDLTVDEFLFWCRKIYLYSLKSKRKTIIS